MSDRTKKYRCLYTLSLIFSILCNVGPLVIYTILGFVNADLTHEKVTLTMTILIVVILTAVAFINKTVIKSRIWIILVGIYICLDYIMTPLIIIAVCQILDELIITPLMKNYKNKLIINKEMDARL